MTRTRLRQGPGRTPRRRLLRTAREYIEPNSTDARTPVLLATNGIVVGSTASAGWGFPGPLPNSWRYWHTRGTAELERRPTQPQQQCLRAWPEISLLQVLTGVPGTRAPQRQEAARFRDWQVCGGRRPARPQLSTIQKDVRTSANPNRGNEWTVRTEPTSAWRRVMPAPSPSTLKAGGQGEDNIRARRGSSDEEWMDKDENFFIPPQHSAPTLRPIILSLASAGAGPTGSWE